mmetsp:Transcript_28282/g.55154  ORF Transcript_28282/g.55154 Transcript_28282/m.55154 type:complete len:117 (+) Transcript_28282:42-392(+)
MKLFKKLASAASFSKQSNAAPLATPAAGVTGTSGSLPPTKAAADKAAKAAPASPGTAAKGRAALEKEYEALREENLRLREKNRLLLQLTVVSSMDEQLLERQVPTKTAQLAELRSP